MKRAFWQQLYPVRLLFGLLLILGILFSMFWTALPLSDDPNYFKFVDQRIWLGIPNFLDVVSNLAFLLVGFWGAVQVWKVRKNFEPERLFLSYFLAGSAILTAIGSAAFHLVPSESSVFIDRLPIAFTLCALLGLLIVDRIDARVGLASFYVLLFGATLSLTLWHLKIGDLRPYIILQYGGLLFIVLLIALCPKGKIPNSSVWTALVLYFVAKLLELADEMVFDLLKIVSGHTLKHIFAALALLKIFSVYSEEGKSHV